MEFVVSSEIRIRAEDSKFEIYSNLKTYEIL